MNLFLEITISVQLLKKHTPQKQQDGALIWSQDVLMCEGSLKEKRSLRTVTWTLV